MIGGILIEENDGAAVKEPSHRELKVKENDRGRCKHGRNNFGWLLASATRLDGE